MRISSLAAVLVLSAAIYFMLTWGFDAWLSLTSATYGLDDAIRSQALFGLNRYLGLAPAGLIKLAAVFAVLKLIVAGVGAVHVFDRLRSAAFGRRANTDIIEAGLMLAVSVTVVSAVPALVHTNVEVVRALLIDFAYAAIAIALCGVERANRSVPLAVSPRMMAVAGAPDELAGTSFGKRWYKAWR